MADSLRIKMTDERKLLMDRAKAIVAADPSDDPPKSKVFDAALTHLIESEENLQEVRDAYPPQTVKDCCNTSVPGLRYRTSVESRWRK